MGAEQKHWWNCGFSAVKQAEEEFKNAQTNLEAATTSFQEDWERQCGLHSITACYDSNFDISVLQSNPAVLEAAKARKEELDKKINDTRQMKAIW